MNAPARGMEEAVMEAAMDEAIRLAENGRWKTAPNPTVGAVLARDGCIVARGWHEACGGIHAEIACLEDAARNGVNPADCTLVVTLEPCNHQGKTPPCTEAVLAAGIRRVVVGLPDPNPVAAGGIACLREAGARVDVGVREDACRELVADFFVWQQAGRPFVILKLAGTLDGRIATRSGHSRWVSGAASRARVHALRAAVGRSGGAVLVGGNTLVADNPLLTARPDDGTDVARQPLAASVISRLPAAGGLRLVKERPTETILFSTAAAAASPVAAELRRQGVRVVGVAPWGSKAGLDLGAVLAHLYEAGCFYVLCEGGGRLGLSLLEADLADEFHLHLAPKVLGDEAARPLFCGREAPTMREAINLRIARMDSCGGDCHLTLRPALAGPADSAGPGSAENEVA
jgi:diaminohydroxyphosphoribosylaminopyrimidine deaminase/5-amino-6-(5-phosphoribosylamino)uracil reductase